MSDTLEDLKYKLRRVQPVEFGVSFVILLVGLILSYRKFGDNSNDVYLLWFLILVGVVLGSYIWIKAINRFFGTFTFYLVEHKWVRKIIAGGSFSYYEYQDPEDQNTKALVLDPISQVINLLLAFVGLSVFILGFLGPDQAEKPFVWGALAILVPLIATPLIPVFWALQSTKIKAFASGNNTTWMVGKKYKNRFNSIISIAAIYTNLRDSDAGDLVDQIKVLWEVVQTGILVLLIPTSIFIIIYYGWFKEELTAKLQESLTLKTYEIVLKEHEMQTSKILSPAKPKMSESPETPSKQEPATKVTEEIETDETADIEEEVKENIAEEDEDAEDEVDSDEPEDEDSEETDDDV